MSDLGYSFSLIHNVAERSYISLLVISAVLLSFLFAFRSQRAIACCFLLSGVCLFLFLLHSIEEENILGWWSSRHDWLTHLRNPLSSNAHFFFLLTQEAHKVLPTLLMELDEKEMTFDCSYKNVTIMLRCSSGGVVFISLINSVQLTWLLQSTPLAKLIKWLRMKESSSSMCKNTFYVYFYTSFNGGKR